MRVFCIYCDVYHGWVSLCFVQIKTGVIKSSSHPVLYARPGEIMIIKWCLDTILQVCGAPCEDEAAGQWPENCCLWCGRGDLYLTLRHSPSGRKLCSRRKHHLSSSMVVISLCSVLRARILKPVIHLNTVTGVMTAWVLIWGEVRWGKVTHCWLTAQ